MLSEIGSNFWLSPIDTDITKEIETSLFNYPCDDAFFTSTGRSAISFILLDIGDIATKTALLPAFTCDTVIKPFISAGYKIEYYNVDESLFCYKERFLESIKKSKPSVILLHNYFGFNTLENIEPVLKETKENGSIIIEDVTQCLYSRFPRVKSDYLVGSFRKWAGIPSGGFALKASGKFAEKTENTDVQLEKAKICAMKAKYNYIVRGQGEKTDFLKMYSEAENLLDSRTDIYKMSDSSVCIQANLNVSELKTKRRENFFTLLRHLKNDEHSTAVFTELPDDVVPLYFLILCDGKRTEIQCALKNHFIYAPVVWPKNDFVKLNSETIQLLYSDMLCIPCDQRYGEDDMKRIVETLKEIK